MKDIFIIASAGLIVFFMLRDGQTAKQPDAGTYWVSNEGNTGFPLQAYTGDFVGVSV